VVTDDQRRERKQTFYLKAVKRLLRKLQKLPSRDGVHISITTEPMEPRAQKPRKVARLDD
jgi:hypothetical protein